MGRNRWSRGGCRLYDMLSFVKNRLRLLRPLFVSLMISTNWPTTCFALIQYFGPLAGQIAREILSIMGRGEPLVNAYRFYR